MEAIHPYGGCLELEIEAIPSPGGMIGRKNLAEQKSWKKPSVQVFLFNLEFHIFEIPARVSG
jgi:hypothetical protein